MVMQQHRSDEPQNKIGDARAHDQPPVKTKAATGGGRRKPVPDGYEWDTDERGNVILVRDPQWRPADPNYDPDDWDIERNEEDGSIRFTPRSDEDFPPAPVIIKFIF